MTRRFLAKGFALLVTFVSVMPAFAEQSNCSQSQRDKAYQRILYQYFQADLFQTLTLFEILEQQCPATWRHISAKGIDPLLLKGGVSLRYGLEDQAAEIFQQVLDSNARPEVQHYAWFLLAKALFSKGLSDDARQAITHISDTAAQAFFSPADRDEWLYLRAQLYPALTIADSHEYLANLSADSIYADYLRYNQGVNLLSAGKLQQGMASLADVAKPERSLVDNVLSGWFSPPAEQDLTERLALQDRANLTLGYALLNEQQPHKALTAFEQVHLHSLDTDAALLGIGWANAQQQEYQLALAAWQTLQNKSDNSEYVLESYLAAAYAYEKAFAPKQALASLQQGMGRYQKQTAQLLNSLQQLDDDFLIRLALMPAEGQAIDSHLRDVMLSDGFKLQLQQLNESLQLSQQLGKWGKRLDTFNLMLDERQQEAQQRVAGLQQNKLLDKLARLQQQRAALQQEWIAAKSTPLLLADDQQLAWLARLGGALVRYQHITQKRQQLNLSALSDDYAKRLNRLKGLLLWQTTQQHIPRIRQTEKALQSLDQHMQAAQEQQRRLQQQLASKANYAAQRSRITTLKNNLAQQQITNQRLQKQQLSQLTDLFKQSLNAQLAQLSNYQLQAQLAMVRLNDKAYRKAQADKHKGKERE